MNLEQPLGVIRGVNDDIDFFFLIDLIAGASQVNGEFFAVLIGDPLLLHHVILTQIKFNLFIFFGEKFNKLLKAASIPGDGFLHQDQPAITSSLTLELSCNLSHLDSSCCRNFNLRKLLIWIQIDNPSLHSTSIDIAYWA